MQQGPQRTSHSTSGQSGLLSSLKGTSGFLLSCFRGIGPHLEFRQKPHSSSSVGTGISGFLLSFNRGVRLHLVLWHGTQLFSRVVKGVQASFRISRGNSGLTSWCCRVKGPHFELRREIQDSSSVATCISGYITSLSSRVVKAVSGHLSS